MAQILDLLGSTILAGLLILTALRLNATVVDSAIVNTQNLVIQEEASLLAELMDHDIVNIGCGDTAVSHITLATGASLAFRIDLDRNGVIDTVAYYYTTGAEVGHILTAWGYTSRSLPVNANDSILFRFSTANDAGPRGTPSLVTSRARRFAFEYFNPRRVSLGSAPAALDSIRFISVSAILSDAYQAADSNIAVVHWQRIYRPKNI